MLKIGEFSKLSRISIRMLRHYDERDLLKPIKTDKFTGYRYYGEHQLITAGRIKELKDMGFGIATIREILKSYDDKKIMEKYFHLMQTELMEILTETKERLLLLDTATERLRKENNAMNYNVTLKTLPERKVASVRMTIPAYEQEGLLWQTLISETKELNMIPDDPCYCSVTFHDGEYKESDVDVEAQKTVRGQYADTEHVKFKTAPPVTFASAVYQGAYTKIGEVNLAVATWVEDNGYEYDGPSFNIYHVSPHETSNPEEFVTEVCYPVRKKKL